MGVTDYQTIKVRFEGHTCFLQIYRPDAQNAINDLLVEECHHVLALCEQCASVVVLEGLPEVFCFGADFKGVRKATADGTAGQHDPEPLYDLWLRLANGPCITVAHVRGKVNAGGLGFVAACDIVLADEHAQFSLSELLFGLFPACVLPFLIRRIGFQKAHYLTLVTNAISVEQAQIWGLVDAWDARSDILVRKHLRRLNCLSKTSIIQYKAYLQVLDTSLVNCKPQALAANRKIFSDADNLERIGRFVDIGKYPWEV